MFARDAGTVQDWCRQVAEDTAAVEGANEAWAEAAGRALKPGFPETIGTPEVGAVTAVKSSSCIRQRCAAI